MATVLRLTRAGAKKRPYYHIVVADSRSPRDGRFIEQVGSYNPMLPRDGEGRVKLEQDRIKHWLSVGAQPTDRVAGFLAESGLIAKRTPANQPKKSAPKAKAQERLREAAEKAEAAEQAKRDAAEAAAQAKRDAEEAAKAPAETPAEEAPAAEATETTEA